MRRIVFGSLAALALLVTPTVANAQTYNQFQVGQFTVSVSQPAPGQPFTISICCFANGTSVTFTVFSDPVVLGTATANSQGVATGTFTIPASLPTGNHTIVAAGTGPNGQPVSYSRAITVVSAGSGALARTGSSSNTVPVAAAGAGAVVVGAGLVAVAMQRRRTTSTI